MYCHTAQIQDEILPLSYRSSHRMLTAPGAGPSCSPSSPLSVTGSAPTTQWIWLHSACLCRLMIQENLGQSHYQEIRLCPVHSGLKSNSNQKRHRWKQSFVLIFVNATENGFSRKSVSIVTWAHYGTIPASCPNWLKHKIYANLIYTLLTDLRGIQDQNVDAASTWPPYLWCILYVNCYQLHQPV